MQRMTPLLGPFAPLFSLADRCRLGKASKRQLEGYGRGSISVFQENIRQRSRATSIPTASPSILPSSKAVQVSRGGQIVGLHDARHDARVTSQSQDKKWCTPHRRTWTPRRYVQLYTYIGRQV